jgi:hypothetical protein
MHSSHLHSQHCLNTVRRPYFSHQRKQIIDRRLVNFVPPSGKAGQLVE